jgi:transcriptional regulator with XRE-family HTH domain
MSSMKLNKNIGGRIKAVRLQNNLTQQLFAESLGVAQGYLSELEKGVKIPSDTFLIALSYRYEISMEWLLAGKGEVLAPSVRQSLNLDFMREVIEAAEQGFEQEKASLSYNKKAEIVVLLYETLLKEEAKFKGKSREKFLRDNVIKFIKLAS